MNYTNKTIWITGASSGIGEALAYEFAKYKPKLILSSRKIAGLEKVKHRCDSIGTESHVVPIDLSNAGQIKDTADFVTNKFGRIDVLVNNAGIGQRSYIVETPLEIDRRIMEVDFFGHVALAKAILPVMLKNKQGQIIVMSSLSGLFGFPLRSGYCAAKHALHGFFETVLAEHYKDGIRVTIICPGRIKTNISLNALTASGNPHGQMDEGQLNGISVEKAAHKMVNAAKREKKIYVIGGKETIMVPIKKFFPGIFYKLVIRINPI
jgi:short-subunit dehydrogenase